MPRALAKAAAIVGLAASSLVVATTSATAATTLPGTPAAAALPEVTMTCAPGQTDLNSAHVGALMTALGVDKPTATRVVSFRPYLQPSDLPPTHSG